MLNVTLYNDHTRHLVRKLLERGYENLLNAQRLIESLEEEQPTLWLTKKQLLADKLAVLLNTLDSYQHEWFEL